VTVRAGYRLARLRSTLKTETKCNCLQSPITYPMQSASLSTATSVLLLKVQLMFRLIFRSEQEEVGKGISWRLHPTLKLKHMHGHILTIISVMQLVRMNTLTALNFNPILLPTDRSPSYRYLKHLCLAIPLLRLSLQQI
jgi:hypothetical protein